MQYKTREYPLFSACGLNCGLCPRYYTVGSSRCPGCAGEGFSDVHPPCGILSCCQRKGVEYCFECQDFPCVKYNSVDSSDSFITHRNQFHDMEKAKQIGMEAYATKLNEKIILLETLLKNYNDGRRKSFFCLAVNLLDVDDIKAVMTQAADEIGPETGQKELSATMVRLFEEMAKKRDVSLNLRK